MTLQLVFLKKENVQVYLRKNMSTSSSFHWVVFVLLARWRRLVRPARDMRHVRHWLTEGNSLFGCCGSSVESPARRLFTLSREQASDNSVGWLTGVLHPSNLGLNRFLTPLMTTITVISQWDSKAPAPPLDVPLSHILAWGAMNQSLLYLGNDWIGEALTSAIFVSL